MPIYEVHGEGPAQPGRAELGTRISQVVEMLGGKREAAKKAGISEAQLYRYIAATSVPSIEPVVALARAAGVAVNWLCTGEGPKMTWSAAAGGEVFARGIDTRLLAAVLAQVRVGFRKLGHDDVGPITVANISASFYAHLMSRYHDNEDERYAQTENIPDWVIAFAHTIDKNKLME